MIGVLYVAVLTVRSSYLRNFEQEAGVDDVPDTVQWWLCTGRCWRIRTFAVDHDIHLWTLDPTGEKGLELSLAKSTTAKNYGDVIASQYEVHVVGATPELLKRSFGAARLAPRYVVDDDFVFWRPDDRDYVTQSRPSDFPPASPAGPPDR